MTPNESEERKNKVFRNILSGDEQIIQSKFGSDSIHVNFTEETPGFKRVFNTKDGVWHTGTYSNLDTEYMEKLQHLSRDEYLKHLHGNWYCGMDVGPEENDITGLCNVRIKEEDKD